MSATMARGMVRDMPSVATSGVVQTTQSALLVVSHNHQDKHAGASFKAML